METEFMTLSGKEIKLCDVCRSCRQTGKCHINDDLPSILEKMLAADGIIVGSPVYFQNMPAQAKMFMDRVGYQNNAGGRKPSGIRLAEQ